MSKLIVLIAMALTLCATNKAVAHDFTEVNADGVTIYYNYISGTNNVKVTYKGDYFHVYSGEVNIPSSVVHAGTTYTVTTIGHSAFASCKNLISVTLPNTITTIESTAFAWCDGLTSVVLGNSVTEIGEEAFEFCESLAHVIIPNSVESIGEDAFFNCVNLSSVTIGCSMDTIGQWAFGNCDKLDSVVCFAETPPQIHPYAFWFSDESEGRRLYVNPYSVSAYQSSPWSDGFEQISDIRFCKENEDNSICYALTDFDSVVVMNKGNGETYSGNVVIPNTVSYGGLTYIVNEIAERAFEDNINLTSIAVSDNVQTIGRAAFKGCTSLSVADLGNGVSEIVDSVFGDCTYLFKVTFGNSVTNISGPAFAGCYALYDVTSNAITPPIINSVSFEDCLAENAELTVPCVAEENYRNSVWRVVFNGNITCTNVGLEEANSETASVVALFPNPAEEFATLSLDNLVSSAEVVVCDLQGRVVSRQSIAAGTQNVALDLTNLSSGTYSVTITSSEGTTTHKLIKQ